MSLSILLVEDTPLALMAAKMMLAGFDTSIVVAENGAKALELAASQKFNLILMDIGLPDTDGFTLTRDIHEKCPLNHDTKTVAVTAHAGDDYKSKVVEYGLVGLIVKPLTLHNFVDMLQSIGINVNKKS